MSGYSNSFNPIAGANFIHELHHSILDDNLSPDDYAPMEIEWEAAEEDFMPPALSVSITSFLDGDSTDTTPPIAHSSPYPYQTAVDIFLHKLTAVPDWEFVLNPKLQIVLSPQEIQRIKTFILKHIQQLYQLTPIDLTAIRQRVEFINKSCADKTMDPLQAQEAIFSLWKPHCLRFSYKTESDLPRTIDLVFDHALNMHVIVHTNQKVHADSSDSIITKDATAKLGSGAAKVVKTAHAAFNNRLVPLARAQVEINSPSEMLDLVKEMQFAQSHQGSQYVDAPFFGSIYTHTKPGEPTTIGCYIYSEKALCSLNTLEQHDILGPKFLTEEEYREIQDARKEGKIAPLYLQLFKDALLGLAEIHAKAQIHRDIKPENLFIYRNAEGKLHLKISDAGIATTLQEHEAPVATFAYASPQVYHANKTGKYRKYFYEDESNKYYSCIGRIRHALHTEYDETDNFAHPADDIYALGVCMIEAMMGSKAYLYDNEANRQIILASVQAFAHQNPQFCTMIDDKRQNRPNAVQLVEAIDLMQRHSKPHM